MRLPHPLKPPHAPVLFLIGLLLVGNGLADQPRTVIHIYKYSRVLDSDVLAQQRFDEFKEILQAKILSLGEEMAGQDAALSYLGGLRPHFVSDNIGNHLRFEGSPNQLLTRWRTPGTLEIFLGRLRRDNGSFSVRSKVFLGELPSYLGSESLQVDLPIRDEQFDTTRDSHSAAILYGLAMDARKRCRPRPEVVALLSAANELLADLPEDLKGKKELDRAVRQGLEDDLPCPGNAP